MARRTKTPQQKKQDSLQRDRRNAFGQSTGGSRKAIPRNKRHVQQSRRTAERAAVHEIQTSTDDNAAEAAIAPRRTWRKTPDIPLGEQIKRKQTRAAGRANRKSGTAEKSS